MSPEQLARFKRYGFIAAGVANIGGVLLFSRCFTNAHLSAAYPSVMSGFGLLVIMVWGLAYLAVSQRYREVRTLVGVFAVEKLIYVLSWCVWMWQYSAELPALFAQSLLAGSFMLIYGLNDVLFMLFFLWVYVSEE